MVALLRQWMAQREIVGLGLLSSFAGKNPKDVLHILKEFAFWMVGEHLDGSDQYAASVFSRGVGSRDQLHKDSIMNIWELSREQFILDLPNRSDWHQVMALCNGLYERYARFIHPDKTRAMAA